MINTDREVHALKPGNKVYWASVKSPHGGGLAIRVTCAGIKSWYYRFRFDGKQDSVTLGRYPSITLREARELHGDALRILADGFNPKKIKNEQKQANSAIWTLGDLFPHWLEFYSKNPTSRGRPPSHGVVEEVVWRWNSYLKQPLGALLVTHITKQQITRLLTELSQRRSREQVRKCLTLIRQMLDYAQAQGQIEENPAFHILPGKVGSGPSKPRTRYLGIEDLKRFLDALNEIEMSHSMASALRILVLTGQRRKETVEARWQDIDLKNRIWTIPEANNKSYRTHFVFLSDAAIEVLRSLPTEDGFIFESDVKGGRPIRPDSVTTAVKRLQGRKSRELDCSAPLSDLPSFSVHDLRRSMATGLGESCGVPPHIIEKMLNHESENKLIRTYQRAEFKKEMAVAWQKWGELLTSK